MNLHPVLAELWRGPVVESLHRGAYVVVDAAGRVLDSAGDIDRPVYPRSANKALQALPLVASGAADALGLDDEALALACASHGGEPRHVAVAAAALARAGAGAPLLECGCHWPMHEASARALAAAGGQPGPLHNNCSGKHAGFVCLAAHLAGAHGDPDALAAAARGYVGPGHAVMREVEAAIEAATGARLADAPRATDGCSIPTLAIPLRALALGFARLATGQGLSPGHAAAARRLRRAVAAHPFLVAGTDRLDTRLMAHFGERVFCKVGAEGVYTAALPGPGLGLAIKLDDGNNARAAEVALVALLRRHLPMEAADLAFSAPLARVALRNWNGIDVGRLQAAGPLGEA